MLFDGTQGTHGAIASGSNAFTDPANLFVAGDVGKLLRVLGAGASGHILEATIASYVNSGEVLLSANAGATVTAATWYYGTDNAPLIAAAITAGGIVALPTGLGLLGSAVSIGGHAKLEGCGKYASLLQPPIGGSAVAVTVPNYGYSTTLVDFGVQYAAQSAALAITATATTHEHNGFDARGLGIFSAGIGVYFGAASYFSIDDCLIENSVQCGVLVQNTSVADSGDSTISNCTIINPSITSGSAIGVWQFSGGGLRLSNTKFNMFNQAYQLALAPGAVTGDLIATGGSYESIGFSAPNAPFLFQRQSASGSFDKVIIDGGQFSGWGTGNMAGGLVQALSNSPAWLTNVVAGSNVNAL